MGQSPVLIVEDVDEISSQMKAMLRAKGHRVLFASDADEAIQVAERERPAMILTDLDLPTLTLLVQLVRGHRDLKKIVVAAIDINQSKVSKKNDLSVVSNFEQLDDLLRSTVGA